MPLVLNAARTDFTVSALREDDVNERINQCGCGEGGTHGSTHFQVDLEFIKEDSAIL